MRRGENETQLTLPERALKCIARAKSDLLSRFAGGSIRGGRIESINCGVDRGAVLRRGCRLYNKQRLTYVQATIFFNTQYTLDVRCWIQKLWR